jgi:hypothetical protein
MDTITKMGISNFKFVNNSINKNDKKDIETKMVMIPIVSINNLDIFNGCFPTNIAKLNIIKYPKPVTRPLSFLVKSSKIMLK